jgi:hypothetical protein
MMLSMFVAGALLSGSCESYVDDDYILEASEVFLGVVLPKDVTSSEGSVRIAVVSVMGGQNPGQGPYRDLDINLDDNYMWSNISSAISHNDENFIESGMYSSSSILENPSRDGCRVSVHVMPQVMYLFIQGSDWRRRSVEPVLVPHNDAWVDHVREVLQP